MRILKNIVQSKNVEIKSYADFWSWFESRAHELYNVVRSRANIERDFFSVLFPKLAQLREGYFYLTGMMNDHTAELVFTADGVIKNFVFVEELVAAAPPISGWKFTAHKPALKIEDVNISMSGIEFNRDNLSFEPVVNPSYPDEIDIIIAHEKANDENRDVKDYLSWREKEFIEKYEGIRGHPQSDRHAVFEAEAGNGDRLIGVMNTDLLSWENKASHPWILRVEIKYQGPDGLPDDDLFKAMDEMERRLTHELNPSDGYLYIGRQTGSNLRETYYACKEFRRASKITSDFVKNHADHFNISL